MRAVARFRLAQACFSVLQRRRLRAERIFERIQLVHRIGHDVHLVNRVALAIDIEIQPHVEEVLVVRRVELRRNHRAVRQLFARMRGAQRKNAGQL